MLESLLSPVRKTAIMYGARLSYNQLHFYHAVLVDAGLVTKASSGAAGGQETWATTARAMAFGLQPRRAEGT
jgi:predicted transcriptional regulator